MKIDDQKGQKKSFYVTTPIYYTSAKLGIGNAYTTLLADVFARWHRLMGEDVFFLTGTDEHGKKIQQKAEEMGMEPKAYVDGQIAPIKDLWKLFSISYDHFIRTTDPEHVEVVKTVFQRLYDQGDIYLGKYEGLYCIPCETWFTGTEAPDGICPDCGRPLTEMNEECYFFRLSKYADRLIAYLDEHPDFILPAFRANELKRNFLEKGLQDLAISRSTFDWGIPLPFDEKHVAYVWVDALSNYLTAIGYRADGKADPEAQAQFEKYWPADLQLVGKDIIRFHGIIWPILLMALDLPMPKHLFAHGWLLNRGRKMSKSKGNTMDPTLLSQIVPIDGIRYYVLSAMNDGDDGDYDTDELLDRSNSFLANDVGNLLSRTVAMIRQNFPEGFSAKTLDEFHNLVAAMPEDFLASGLDVQVDDALAEADPAVRKENRDRLIWNLCARMRAGQEAMHKAMEAFHVVKSLDALAAWTGAANLFIDQTKPWALAKSEDPADRDFLALGLLALTETMYQLAVYMEPFVPGLALAYLKGLGMEVPEGQAFYENFSFASCKSLDHIQADRPFEEVAALYPRLKKAETLKAIEDLIQKAAKEEAAKEKAAAKDKAAKEKAAAKDSAPAKEGKDE